jgi:hypothetical protein
MRNKHRTALGRVIDMGELIAKNERVRAVGNMKVNARGDTIDSFGRIVEPATNKVNQNYAKTVGNRSAHAVRNKPVRKGNEPGVSPKPVKTSAPDHKLPVKELHTEERELEADFDSDLEIENIKAQENKNGR